MTSKIWSERVFSPYSVTYLSGPVFGSTSAVLTNSIVGSDQPNWRTLIANRADATGSLSVDVTRVLQKRSGTFAVTYTILNPVNSKPEGSWTEAFAGSVAPLGVPNLPSLSTKASNKALTSILSQVRDQTKGFAGVTFLGELRDTIRQIRSPLKSLRQGLADYMGRVHTQARRMKRHRYPSTDKQLQAVNRMVAGTYLEYTFGLQPLLNDINDAAQAVARLVVDKRPSQVLLSGRGTDEWYGSTGFDAQLANYFHYKYTELLTYKSVTKYVACYVPTVSGLEALEDPLTRARQMLGFTLADFVPDLWNCLPWSFVVDYFGNFGDILEAGFTARDALTWVYRTDVKRVTSTRRCDPDVSKIFRVGGSRIVSAVGSHMGLTVVERTSIVRTRGVTLPLIPEFQAKLPGIKQDFNLAALFAQQTDIRNLYKRG